MLDKAPYCNGLFDPASSGGIVLLHGGAGAQDPRGAAHKNASRVIEGIAARGAKALADGASGLDVVRQCLFELEADPCFNAGRGAALQSDGQARLTAAVMSGPDQVFSGVMGLEGAIHPSLLALMLQGKSTRVVCPPGTAELARRAGLKHESPVTPERLARWEQAKKEGRPHDFDTVGCVVVTAKGELFAGTSTGGRGFEAPGRVSDAATVAGTYASAHAAVSATGIGEEIVDDGLALRIESRVRDGMALENASSKCFDEATSRERSYGWIAASSDGAWNFSWTTEAMTFAGATAKDGVFTSSLSR
jgi:L-asparaginase